MPFRQALLFMLFISNICLGQKNKSVFFVGNSYTYSNDLPNLISQIATSKGHTFSYKQHTPGGASFSSHVQDTSWHDLLHDNSYDYLVLQGQSAELSGDNQNIGKHISANYYQAEYLHHVSKLKDSCRKTIFFLTWGYKWSDVQYYLDMQDNVSNSYVELAQSINASVAPVGEAWRSIILNYPNLDLHSADLSHPNMAGSYLAACVFYISIFKETPIGAWHPASISSNDARILQEAAYNTINDNQKKWNFNLAEPSCIKHPATINNHLWETYDVQTNQPFQKIQFPSNETGYAKCSFPNMLYTTRDKGARWDSLKIPNGTTHFDFHFITDSIGFIVSSGFRVDSTSLDSNSNLDQFLYPRLYKTVNAGITWQELPLDTALYAIQKHGTIYWTYIPNINIRFDNEDNGTIIYSNPYSIDSMFSLKTTSGGLQWQYAELVFPNAHPYPSLISADTIYISSAEQSNDTLQLWRTINGGANWDVHKDVNFNCCKTIYRRQHVHTVHQTQEGVMITNNLHAPWILKTTSPNTNWDTVSLVPIIGRLEALTELNDGTLFALFENAKNHRIATSNDLGKTWKLESYHKHELNTITHTNEYVYAAGKRGIILRRKLEIPDTIILPSGSKETITVYPNPADDKLNFLLPDKQYSFPLQLTIYDVHGNIIDVLSLTKRKTTYSTNHLQSGLYFYQAISSYKAEKPERGKFIIR